MRLSIFVVMLVWTLDKLLDPAHAAAVFSSFYFVSGLGAVVMYVIGAAELVILLGFVAGLAKRWTYGAVLVFHAISTLMPFKMYLSLSEGRMFFTAWPMLAACFALYLLRNDDVLWTIKGNRQAG